MAKFWNRLDFADGFLVAMLIFADDWRSVAILLALLALSLFLSFKRC